MNGAFVVDVLAEIRRRKRASAIVVQKYAGIGYHAAVAILDALTASGCLGPDRPDGSRAICVCVLDTEPAGLGDEHGAMYGIVRRFAADCPVHRPPAEPTRDDF